MWRSAAVWCGVLLCGVECCCEVRCGVLLCGVECCCVVWSAAVR